MAIPPIRRSTRGLGWGILSVTAALTVALSTLLPAPYVIESPGPTFDALADIDGAPIVAVEGTETYPTDGSLRLLTVSTHGSPQYPATWLEVVEGFLDPAEALLPMEVAYPAGQSVEESNQAGQLQMTDSQQTAIAAALLELGYEVPATVTVAQVMDGTPAAGLLEEGDVIRTVNDQSVVDVVSIREAIAADPGPARFAILRDGVEQTVSVTPLEQNGARMVGIVPSTSYALPVDVSIDLPDVGGPSAGTIFALGVIDELTPGALTGGVDWAGTGTIAVGGDVGAIGGIVQKMHGARDAGAEWMFLPAANCAETTGHVPDGLTLVAVDTLADAVHAIEAVAAAGGVASELDSALPGCG